MARGHKDTAMSTNNLQQKDSSGMETMIWKENNERRKIRKIGRREKNGRKRSCFKDQSNDEGVSLDDHSAAG